MTSSTDGTYAGTTQTQICQQRKFREGTYASHVLFRDAPLSGPAGDQPVESFYTISHAAGAVLSPARVKATVAGLQEAGVSFRDTVPASGLSSPCNL